MPIAPIMLDARDAYLAADLMRFGGANQIELWLALREAWLRRGRVSTNTQRTTDTDPKPDFASPAHNEATVTFRAVAPDERNAHRRGSGSSSAITRRGSRRSPTRTRRRMPPAPGRTISTTSRPSCPARTSSSFRPAATATYDCAARSRRAGEHGDRLAPDELGVDREVRRRRVTGHGSRTCSTTPRPRTGNRRACLSRAGR